MSIKRFMNKKVVAIGLAAGITLGGAGAAFAYFTSNGSGNGTATVGNAGTWSVGTIQLAGTAIYPGQGANAVQSDTVQNPTGNGSQNLSQLEVTIASVSENAPGLGLGSCSTADFALTAASHWTVAGDGESATVSNLSSPTDIAPGHFYVDGTGDSATTGNALPSGLALTMLDSGSNQDGCQGATVTLTLAAS
jgi:hypothetical protein